MYRPICETLREGGGREGDREREREIEREKEREREREGGGERAGGTCRIFSQLIPTIVISVPVSSTRDSVFFVVVGVMNPTGFTTCESHEFQNPQMQNRSVSPAGFNRGECL